MLPVRQDVEREFDRPQIRQRDGNELINFGVTNRYIRASGSSVGSGLFPSSLGIEHVEPQRIDQAAERGVGCVLRRSCQEGSALIAGQGLDRQACECRRLGSGSPSDKIGRSVAPIGSIAHGHETGQYQDRWYELNQLSKYSSRGTRDVDDDEHFGLGDRLCVTHQFRRPRRNR